MTANSLYQILELQSVELVLIFYIAEVNGTWSFVIYDHGIQVIITWYYQTCKCTLATSMCNYNYAIKYNRCLKCSLQRIKLMKKSTS